MQSFRYALRASRCIRPVSKLGFHSRRWTSTNAAGDLTTKLQSDLKAALKAKDSFAATTIRSVLSEVYAAQKRTGPTPLTNSDVVSVLRKAELQRLESAKQFDSASRPDLAQKEEREAALLAAYLRARLQINEIDKILQQIVAAVPERDKKAKGLCLKAFYATVDRNMVDGDLVRQRIDYLFST